MVAVIEAFKIKPFDLEPVFAAWTSAPTFHGNPKKDMPVDDWLNEIKKGCNERHVPKEYWHKVGYHFMGPKARERMDEVKKVMRNMHGGKYKWNWKSFKVAMKNMGWDIDVGKTEEIKVKSSGIWWIVGRGRSDSVDKEKESNDDAASVASVESSPPRPPPKRSRTSWDISTFKPFPTPRRSTTMSNVEVVSDPSPTPPPTPPKTPPKKARAEKTEKSEKHEKSVAIATQSSPPVPSTPPANTTTTVAQAPVWLINACQALDFLTTEHPKVMTAVSAVLITVGSIPAIPVISAGAGGAFLASGTAHALGSIAVGIGSWLKATSEQQTQANPNQPAQGQIQAAPSH